MSWNLYKNSMNKNNIKDNKIILLLLIAYNFVWSIIFATILFVRHLFKKSPKIIPENKFMDILNFLFHIWPKSFWKKPNWIKIWRSISTFIHYAFYKNEVFKERKK